MWLYRMINSSYIPKEHDSISNISKFNDFLDRTIIEQNIRIFKDLNLFSFRDRKLTSLESDYGDNFAIEEDKQD